VDGPSDPKEGVVMIFALIAYLISIFD